MKEVQLAIDGMSCSHCVASVRKALAAVPGVHVKDVQVGTAQLHIDPESVTVGSLIDAVQDVGYEAREA